MNDENFEKERTHNRIGGAALALRARRRLLFEVESMTECPSRCDSPLGRGLGGEIKERSPGDPARSGRSHASGAQRLPSATISTKMGEKKPIKKRMSFRRPGESVRAVCSSAEVVFQATQAAAIAMPKVESGIPTFDVT